MGFVEFDADRPDVQPVVQHRIQHGILGSFDIDFQQINMIVPQFPHDVCQSATARFEAASRCFLEIDEGVADMSRIGRCMKKKIILLVVKAPGMKLKVRFLGCNRGRVIQDSWGRIEGMNRRILLLNECEIERRIETDSERVTRPSVWKGIDRNPPGRVTSPKRDDAAGRFER